MNSYFKIMTWLYMLTGSAAAVAAIVFQIKGFKDEAIYCIVCVFICGLMLGLRTWQRKRMIKLEQFLKEKHEKEQAEKSGKKK